MQKLIIIIGVIVLIFLGFFYFSKKQPDSKSGIITNEIPTITMTQVTEPNSPPEMQIDVSKTYTAVMKTEKGDITIELDAKNTPITVNNFVYLARKDFYNNTIFHRVIKGFMIQGGDPKGDGTGGPGYSFEDEPVVGQYSWGTLAMANAGPNTNGSQFFIMHADYNLPKNYVIFGKVISGLETVDGIAESEVTQSPGGEMSQPVTPVKIINIEITEK